MKKLFLIIPLAALLFATQGWGMGFGKCISSFKDTKRKMEYSNLQCSLFQEIVQPRNQKSYKYEGIVTRKDQRGKIDTVRIEFTIKDPSESKLLKLKLDDITWDIPHKKSGADTSKGVYDFRLTPKKMEIQIDMKNDFPDGSNPKGILGKGGYIYIEATYTPAGGAQGSGSKSGKKSKR
ncbi:MAG: hypothetical protein DRQ88_00730 [Epsilonproteobacteria bacterium]|nr:MAG: hypothetical protein DRQ89_10265 [Campylobacterota bacterium]RLA68159.1 MAG: hypothetical protein DRQ88_00730 [Campylobacterota bacterium]